MKVMQFPLAKISIAFCLGLTYTHFLPISLFLSTLFLSISIALLIVFQFVIKKSRGFAFAVITTSIALGFWITSIHFEPNQSNHFLHLTKEDSLFVSEIQLGERMKSSTKNSRYIGHILSINEKESCGKVIVNFAKDKTNEKLENGTVIGLKTEFYLNRNPINPNQFDYGKYLENQQIYAQVYTDYKSIYISSKSSKGIQYYGSKIRNTIIRNLEKRHFKKEELSIVIALILGQQQDISKEVLLDYQYAGAIHILSVSGLHVGFILLFIVTLLKPISNNKRGLIFKLTITLLALWSFGIIAGLAPSVVRSVTMFSFVAIGLFLKRSVNIYHSLLVSMFLILLFRPSFLFDVGFQLSYLALFFIVWLQPLFASVWTPKYKIVNYFWEIITVSFAAQIGTLPLSIYYFHQFPGLFFVTNLIILPMLSIILAIALVVVILAGLDYVPLFLTQLLEKSIQLLNSIISWVASFEGFIFKDIPMDSLMMSTSYLMIISIFIWMKKPNYRNLVVALISVLIFQLGSLYSKYGVQTEEEFIVFNQKNQSLITERNASEVIVFTSEKDLKLHNNWSLQSYLVGNFCEVEKINLVSNLYHFKGKKIALIDSSGIYLKLIKPDVLILTQSPKVNLKRVIEQCQPKQIVVDASNYSSYKKLWKATCEKEKIPFHDTSEKGFYKL
ncbi:MAG: ComEC family competence protein [Flavobacterium sp.]|nr:ComEC family competence protein [Flavobacterium sp.]